MRQPTIKDVARQAGVDPSTVSRVLNDRLRTRIAPQTMERIRQAARELNYTPHASARALVARRTQTIGFVCFEISDPYQAELAQAAQELLEAHGYHLIVCSANRQSANEALYTRLLGESRVDGILVVASTGASRLLARQWQHRGAVIVAAGPPLLPETSDVFTACVAHDNFRGGGAVGAHLAALGHTRIGYTVGGGLSSHTSALRLDGLRDGLAAAGMAADLCLSSPIVNTFEGGYHAARELLERRPDLTALFAYNDRVALGALLALSRAGRRVPADVSVVGYQDLPFAAYNVPPLTTVRIPVQRIAELATSLLLRALAGEEIRPREVMIHPELVVRETTAPPPDAPQPRAVASTSSGSSSSSQEVSS